MDVDIEVVLWTLVFLGGNLLIVILLLAYAFRRDREKARQVGDTEQG